VGESVVYTTSNTTSVEYLMKLSQSSASTTSEEVSRGGSDSVSQWWRGLSTSSEVVTSSGNSHSDSDSTSEEVQQQQWRQFSDGISIASEQRAVSFLGLAASQHSSDALLLLGDAHYYGKAGFVPSPRVAAGFYRLAGDLQHTQALFNLGVLHIVGEGVSRDRHLAKRFLDLAAETDSRAKSPRDFLLSALDVLDFVRDNLCGDKCQTVILSPILTDGQIDLKKLRTKARQIMFIVVNMDKLMTTVMRQLSQWQQEMLSMVPVTWRYQLTRWLQVSSTIENASKSESGSKKNPELDPVQTVTLISLSLLLGFVALVKFGYLRHLRRRYQHVQRL
jgi:hypothetical protein